MSSIASRIREARLRAGISQSELGRRVGVSRAAVSQWESGKTKGLTPDNLIHAADALEVEIRWLGTGLGPCERTKLEEDEMRWLHLYQHLSPSKRQAALEIMDLQGSYGIDSKDKKR